MKWTSRMIGALGALLLAAPVAAQQSLGDVAGSIKLKRPEGESVVIDSSIIKGSRRIQNGGSSPDELVEATQECLDAAQGLLDLMGETRDGSNFYTDGWRERVADAGRLLGEAQGDLQRVFPGSRYAEVQQHAEDGADSAMAGLQILRDAIANDRPVFSAAKTQIAMGIGALDAAKTETKALARAETAGSAAPQINPIDAAGAIDALCRSRYGERTGELAGCVASQQAALDAMNLRFAATSGLETSTFNIIRNDCRYEWPDDYVSQDRCERNRIAAKAR
jgi:hypothetical protein